MPAILYSRERELLQFIGQFIQRYGFAPTLREVADAMGLSSVATVHEHIHHLIQKGFLKKLEGYPRSIEIVKEKVRLKTEASLLELPVLGFIAAGKPLEPHTDPDLYISVASNLIAKNKTGYTLQVKGDSMIEDGILDGDYVIIQHQNEAKNGDIVVAILANGLATLKRIFFEKDRIRLEPANEKMTPIFTTQVKIQGRVVGVVRKYR